MEMTNEIKIGDYAFKGGKFSADPKAYPNCQGVVAWLNPDPNAPIGERGLILMPDSVLSLWADEYCKTGICDEDDGKSNTKNLVDYCRKHGVRFPAVRWCYLYSQNGVKPGEGFLPAPSQLKRIVANRDIINPALKKIGGKILKGRIWSSCDWISGYAWMVAIDGTDGSGRKDGKGYVRCVIAI